MTPDWTTFDLGIFLLFVGMLLCFGAWASNVIGRDYPSDDIRYMARPERRR